MAIIKYYIIIRMFIIILLILFLINISSLIIACLAYTKKIYPPTLPTEYPPSLRNTANLCQCADSNEYYSNPKILLKYIENQNIPILKSSPLEYIMTKMKPRHTKNDLWLEFGVASGGTINYISKNTTNIVYGFDSFEGLPEKWRDDFDKGVFSRGGNLPKVNKNVVLIKGLFDKTLAEFMNTHKKKKITFMHIDCDLYSSTKTIFNLVKNNLDKNCIIVFDELINYPGYTG